jgi:hypothetical protein
MKRIAKCTRCAYLPTCLAMRSVGGMYRANRGGGCTQFFDCAAADARRARRAARIRRRQKAADAAAGFLACVGMVLLGAVPGM